MNARYFKERICEELEDASHYLKKAIDEMKAHPEWSKCFKHMAEGEQEHATDLYKMFMEMYTTSDSKDQFMEAMRDAIMDCFSVNMRKIEDLKTTYDMMMYKQMEAPATKKEEPKTWSPQTISAPSSNESSTLKAISD